jgi:hypothetical protein
MTLNGAKHAKEDKDLFIGTEKTQLLADCPISTLRACAFAPLREDLLLRPKSSML